MDKKIYFSDKVSDKIPDKVIDSLYMKSIDVVEKLDDLLTKEYEMWVKEHLEEERTDFGLRWWFNKDKNDSQHPFSFCIYTYSDDPSTVYLSNVYVYPEKRGNGFGSRTLEIVKSIFKEEGYHYLALAVDRDSSSEEYTNLVRWYESHGFEVYYDDKYYTWMIVKLAS